jgi:hypothetical protein
MVSVIIKINMLTYTKHHGKHCTTILSVTNYRDRVFTTNFEYSASPNYSLQNCMPSM